MILVVMASNRSPEPLPSCSAKDNRKQVWGTGKAARKERKEVPFPGRPEALGMRRRGRNPAWSFPAPSVVKA